MFAPCIDSDLVHPGGCNLPTESGTGMCRKIRKAPRIVSLSFNRARFEVVTTTFRFRDRFEESTHLRIGKQGLIFGQTCGMFLCDPNRLRFAAFLWRRCSARPPNQRSARGEMTVSCGILPPAIRKCR